MNVLYKCRPDRREEFLDRICSEGIDEASRAEEGNITYDYYTSVERTDELLLLEKWREADALAVHGQQPHFVRLGGFINEYVADCPDDAFLYG